MAVSQCIDRWPPSLSDAAVPDLPVECQRSISGRSSVEHRQESRSSLARERLHLNEAALIAGTNPELKR